MLRFFGYGRLKADYWFIGLEEGGGEDVDELCRRLNAWKKMRMKRVVDRVKFHKLIDSKFGQRKPQRIQATWGKAIRLFLATKQESAVTRNRVRKFQYEEFGRSHGDTLMLDLMPLPNRNLGKLKYGPIDGMPELQHRKDYEDIWRSHRTSELKRLVANYNPKCVVFLSQARKQANIWHEIAGTDVDMVNSTISRHRDTSFVVVPHPRHGTNALFEEVGQRLSKSRARR
jgi:hypothetical protein